MAMYDNEAFPGCVSVENYLRTPSLCPSCRSSHISAGKYATEGSRTSQSMSCDECGLEWFSAYDLIGYIIAEGT